MASSQMGRLLLLFAFAVQTLNLTDGNSSGGSTSTEKAKIDQILSKYEGKTIGVDFSGLSEGDYMGFNLSDVKAAALSTMGEVYAKYNISFVESSTQPIIIVMDPLVNYSYFNGYLPRTSPVLRYGKLVTWLGMKFNPRVYVDSIGLSFSNTTGTYIYHETPGGQIVKLNTAARFGTAIGNTADHELGHRLGIEYHTSGGLMAPSGS